MQGNDYALKRLLIDHRDVEKVKTEVTLMVFLYFETLLISHLCIYFFFQRQLNHKNIVSMRVAKLLRPTPSQCEAIIVMEYCPAGILFILVIYR